MGDDDVVAARDPRAAAVRRLMAAFTAQDRHAIQEILAPTCVWRVPGRNALAGEYRGLPAVMRLFGTLKRVLDEPAGFEIVDIALSEDRVIVFQYGLISLGGRTLKFKECLVYRFAEGRVVEVDEFQFDQAAFDDAFSVESVAAGLA